jgi:hypothetical protein
MPPPSRHRTPDKDRPIFLAAMQAQATILVTGDQTHFGPYFGKIVAGILILPPADFLALKQERE